MRSVFSRFNKNTVKKCIPFLIMVMLSGVIAVLLATWSDEAMKDLVQNFYNQIQENLDDKNYENSDISAENYDVADDKYIAQNDDPHLIISGVNNYVKTIDIYFKEDLEQDIPVELFWGIEGESFVADRMVTALAQKGSTQLKINFENQVTDLRIDIGTSKNVSFALDSIEINHKITLAEIFACMLNCMKKSIWFDRFQILFLILCFILIHFVVNIRKMYNILFDNRWLVAGLVLIFLCVNGYHGNSITAFDKYVQPGMGNDYIQPVLGQTRDIRSDEWMVSLPNSLSARYLDDSSGKYNYILRGTDTEMVRTTVIGLINPINLLGRLASFLGSDGSYSYSWYVNIFLTFLFNSNFP